MTDDIDAFAEDLRQEILSLAEADGTGQLRPAVFADYLIDRLVEQGELENATCAYHKAVGVEVHGYGIDDEDTLNLLSINYTSQVPTGTMPPTDVNTAMRRMTTFWERCRDSAYHEQLEPSSPAYDMAQAIHQAAPGIRRVRLIVGTDARSGAEQLSIETENGLEQRRIVWDVVRLHNSETSGREREPIEVDFVSWFGRPLPCLLGLSSEGDAYQAMLAVIPGEWLARIYEEYNARLLELNVRSFLQATGKVNRGIRKTLKEEPDRFLAYNNGISATAAGVDLVALGDGGIGIGVIRDLQIVNGGQTTASVHRAMLAKVNLRPVGVQAKITVAAPGRLEEIVPLISRFANSQNKVSDADLSANEPFHVEIEKLSRSIWTPVVDGATKQTHWFYERARGQYRDAIFMAGTPAEQKKYRSSNPPDQRFSKTDLAKYRNAWDQLPHHVARGAQKNFTAFTGNLKLRHVVPDRGYFEDLAAITKLWRRTEQIVRGEKFIGYRANLVAYSIAKLSHSTQQRVNLQRVWERQALSSATEHALAELSHLAWRVLVDGAPAGVNIGEWIKRDECWSKMRAAPYVIPPDLAAELSVGSNARSGSAAPDEDSDGDQKVARVTALGGDGWLALHNWARQTGSLENWQCNLASDISRRLLTGRPPTRKQSEFAGPILDTAKRLGFTQ